jgi:predicted CXXCH cytochrome family protein
LSSDRYEEPVFAELSIGCERCHGPGERHVQLHSEVAAVSQQDTIVNPADLPVAKRESVCNQCHLLGRSVIPRYGRQFFDFRPGDDLEDIFVVLSQETDVELHGQLKAVNQVEQMRASQCYKASEGQLGCTSCHDPHSVPSAEQRDEHFRMRCVSCHESKGCSLDLSQRKQAPTNNSCIHCHMPAKATMDVPHTSMTDHRILRSPEAALAADEQAKNSHGELTVFDDAGSRLPRVEVERARGIALMTAAWSKRDEHLAAIALTHLSHAVHGNINDRLATSDDLPLLDELAAGYMLLHDLDMAGACWKRMLSLDPNSESALMGMAKVAEHYQDLQALKECLDRVLKINPTFEDALSLLVTQRHYSKDSAGAIRAAERVLETNPTRTELRSWLVDVYRTQGNADNAREHEEFLSKTSGTTPVASADPHEVTPDVRVENK